ncbi:NAD(P)H-dependent glycerol-3-phosphate dehydrogenase [Salinisphaera hydrothermalis]|uniref:Glycerol-3-phosphate dehydrogenase [NAD(P)+] n=1 Tax=Salinisphaera hydrothermalis (strain C41B8) TaxID=1304275 RepID=A0A084IIK1_SALHC|nr:NAD(P)H-dependent glycerol-3-phosphate dehydrogenase [Salinisphaera hydrothermalis]KEZ76535.1 NAD(P)H-dependent glycerol-3-phosphate dehydrogenase [Salinisphaera hydrothermalis C41B8]
MADNRPACLAVIGAGSWGTALAVHLARRGHAVRLWGRDPSAIEAMAESRTNARYLPGVEFPATLEPTAELAAAVDGADDIVVVVPSHALRACLEALAPLLAPHQRVLWATKGLEPETALLPHEVAAEVLGASRATGVLSGPSFAGEVGRGLPTAVTIASADAEFAADMARVFHDGVFRVYTSQDVIGVGVGGAVKNVLAIAVGISDGLGYGANARALLITRGLSEMMRLGVTLGGTRETLTGMAGLGDMLLTCSDDQSRNRRMGLALAAGDDVPTAEARIGQVVEGVRVAREVHRMALERGIDMPIAAQAYRVLHEGDSPQEAVRRLTDRPSRSEAE